ncbi:MAG: hypothetical protein K0S47_1939 [Herbinix sp.]|nr:hypothetical protein [Herbinix sp.]
MAKCKACNTVIPDETEYCKSCIEKDLIKSNESYLDSLLNSVKNTTSDLNNLYTKKNISKHMTQNKSEEDISIQNKDKKDMTSKNVNMVSHNTVGDQQKNKQNNKLQNKTEQSDLHHDDFSELDDVDTFDLDDDIEFADIDLDDVNDYDQFSLSESEDLIQVQDEDLFGADFANLFQEDSINQTVDTDLIQINNVSLNDDDYLKDLHTDHHEKLSEINDEPSSHESDIEMLQHNILPNEMQEYEEDDIDPYFEDLIKSMELEELADNSAEGEVDNDYNQTTISKNEETQDSISDNLIDEFEGFEEVGQDDEFLSLLNQINSDDPVSEDVHAINDLLNGVSDIKNVPNNVGDVFSDALTAVSSLDDPLFEMELLDLVPDQNSGEKSSKKKKSKKVKDKKIEKIKKSSNKKNLFQRLFGNVKNESIGTDKNSKKISEDDEEAAVTAETKVKKNNKKEKKKDNKKQSSNENIEIDDSSEEKSKVKDKKEQRKQKKEKKIRDKVLMESIDEIEEDSGRINRVGASIVFLFFGMIVTLLLIGTNIFSYSLSISSATNYFSRHKYTQAYNEVYGIDIKDEDIEIYDKIMTVMYVNKQLNSYNNYYAMGDYPKALDSLLKGLERYDKYIELATILGINSDLDYVRNQIIAEINNVYSLTEEEAIKIISSDNQGEYSMNVYNVVLEKMNVIE